MTAIAAAIIPARIFFIKYYLLVQYVDKEIFVLGGNAYGKGIYVSFDIFSLPYLIDKKDYSVALPKNFTVALLRADYSADWFFRNRRNLRSLSSYYNNRSASKRNNSKNYEYDHAETASVGSVGIIGSSGLYLLGLGSGLSLLGLGSGGLTLLGCGSSGFFLLGQVVNYFADTGIQTAHAFDGSNFYGLGINCGNVLEIKGHETFH
ncbi:MAG: hypothetical protein PUG24_05790 [Eubacteriales bacterium]|nr:hypothetical protein [Eubacteriales bacterium]